MAAEDPHHLAAYRDRWEVVMAEIRRRILHGEMLPGSRIFEAELADSFGVSRGPVREALRALEVSGLILRLSRKGSYVAPVRRRDVDEIYTLRCAVEEFAIRRALSRDSVKLAASLDTSITKMQGALAREEPSAVVDSDIDFHSAFYLYADHNRLLGVWATLTDPLRIMMRLSSRQVDSEWQDSVDGHLPIATAARDADVERCVPACIDHLTHARELVMGYVERQDLQASEI